MDSEKIRRIVDKIGEFIDIPERLNRICNAIQENGAAVRAQYEKNDEQWRRVEVRLADDQVRSTENGQDVQNRIQRQIRNAAWAAFLAAVIYALITLGLWCTAQHQLEIDQRGWLVFDPNYSDNLTDSGSNMIVPLRFINLGKTPIRKINGFVEVHELSKGERPLFKEVPARRIPILIGILYPGNDFANTTAAQEMTDSGKPVALDNPKRTEINKSNAFVNVWGKLEYDDAFQRHHWVQFCHAIASVPEGKTQECVDYNLVDPPPSRWQCLKDIFRR